MDIMNLIHEICLTKIKINNTPKWRFITKNKLIKNLDNTISKFLDLDIFAASDYMITFLSSLDKNIVKNIEINRMVIYCATMITMDIIDDSSVVTTFTYYPETKRFEVWNKDVAYTIYRNTKICNRINKMWEPLCDNIKTQYIDIITKSVEYM